MPTGRAVIIGCWPPGGADGGGSCLPHSRLLVLLPWRKEPCGGSARGHGRCVAPPWQGHLPLVQIGGLGRALHWVHRAPERRSYGGRLARFGLDQNVCGDHVTTTPAFSTYSTAIAQIRRPGSRRSRPPVWRGRACGRRARRGAQVPGRRHRGWPGSLSGLRSEPVPLVGLGQGGIRARPPRHLRLPRRARRAADVLRIDASGVAAVGGSARSGRWWERSWAGTRPGCPVRPFRFRLSGVVPAAGQAWPAARLHAARADAVRRGRRCPATGRTPGGASARPGLPR